MKTKQKNEIEWKQVPLGEILDYEQPQKYIIETGISENENSNSVPVLTAGKSFVLGYTREKEGIYDKLPTIIFDDFTTDTKFVEFPFKVKSSAMKILQPKNDLINLKYIFLAMQKIKLDSETHKRYYLSKYQYEKISLPFSNGKPDLETQKQIVAVLEKAEALKQKQKKVLDLYDEYLKSVFWEMFLKEKGKWEEVELGDKDLFEIQSGGTPSKAKKEYWENGNIPWIGSTACKDLSIYEAEQFITEEGLKNSSAKLFSKGTILIALVGATIGKTGILKFDCTTNQNIAGINIKDKKKINEIYLFFMFQNLYNQFISLSSDSFKMANLTFVRSLKIPLPPLPLQQKFAVVVEKVEKLKEKQKKALSDSGELFNALMQRAFRGDLG